MQKYKNITNLVGNTPLIKLKKASEITGCNILAKAEYLNPGQSIKDRAASQGKIYYEGIIVVMACTLIFILLSIFGYNPQKSIFKKSKKR